MKYFKITESKYEWWLLTSRLVIWLSWHHKCSKLELVPAPGIRVRQSSIYKPNQEQNFKISRGKFSDFLTCSRCFYMDRVKGIVSPGMPGWTLNETTDRLLKKGKIK